MRGRLFAVCLLTLLLAAPAPAQPDAAFREGQELRHDAAAARPKFIAAARGYDAAWLDGDHSATVAVNRGRAHALAGDLPGAVAAVHAGLWESPYDAELQRDLETLRDEVAYPSGLRPEPPRGWRHRVSGWDLFLFTAACVLTTVVGLVRRFTARDGWAVPAAAVGGVGLLLAVATAWQLEREARREADKPVLVLTRDVPLRKGNGETYPPQLDWKLPRGAEVRELHRRGGWVQVEVANGTVGWVPEANAIR